MARGRIPCSIMKHNIASLIEMVISESKQYIIDNGGNVAQYLEQSAESEEFGWYFYLTDEEVTEYERADADRREEIREDIRNFIQENYDYNILKKNYSIMADDIHCFNIETHDIQFELKCAADKRPGAVMYAQEIDSSGNSIGEPILLKK